MVEMDETCQKRWGMSDLSYFNGFREGFRNGIEEAARLMESVDPEKPSQWLVRREYAAQAIRDLTERKNYE